MTNWQELAAASPYRAAVAVEQVLHQGDLPEAARGMQELIEALTRSDKRALKSHLIRLMAHIIKWQTQPERRRRSWRATIRNARQEIAEIQEDTPSLSREVVEAMWDRCFSAATEDAEGDMNQESPITALSWGDVFEQDFEIE